MHIVTDVPDQKEKDAERLSMEKEDQEE